MKTLLLILLLILFLPVVGSGEEDFDLTIDAPETLLTIKAAQTITIHGDNGRKAIIDFSGDRVKYEGDLPVNESARKIFEVMFIYYKSCYGD